MAEQCNYYYLQMLTQVKVFSDEVDKKKFLDMLKERFSDERFKIAAFILLDDQIHMVMESEACSPTDARRYMASLRDHYFAYYLRNGHEADAPLQGVIKLKRLDSYENMRECSVQIHNLPKELGYVSKIDYYFWSSFLSYQGRYEWPFLSEEQIVYHPNGTKEGTEEVTMELDGEILEQKAKLSGKVTRAQYLHEHRKYRKYKSVL